MKPKKILHLIDFLGPGGVQELLRLMIQKSSPEFSHEVVALTSLKPYYEQSIREAGASVRYLSNSWVTGLALKLPILVMRLRKILKKSDPDILHLHMPGSMITGCMASQGLRSKRVLGIYAWKKAFPFWVYPAIRFLLPSFDKVTWVDKSEIAWLPDEKFVKIFPGVDPPFDFMSGVEKVKQEFGLQGKRPILFSIARLHPDKGHADAILAFAEVRRQFPQAVLFVMGEGSDRETARLHRLAESVGSQGIIFTGHRKDLKSFLSLGGFFLRPSVNECGNMSTILSAFAGVVAVGYSMKNTLSSDIEMIRDGQTGKIVPMGDYQKMAQAVIDIWSSPQDYSRMVSQAIRHAHAEWNIQKTMVEPVERAYRQLNPVKDKIHVVQMIDFLGQGGAQEIVKHILYKGASPDIQYTVIVLTSLKKELYDEKYRNSGAKVIYLTGPWVGTPYFYFPLLCFRARKLLKELRPDVLHLHLQGSMMVGCIASLGLPLKRMLNSYAWPSQLQFWVYPMMHFFTPMIERIQFLSREAMPWVPEKKFIQAYAGADLDIDFQAGVEGIRREFGLSGHENYFFSVGRFHPDKGHDTAIRVFAEIYKKNKQSLLFVIGDGPQDEWNRLRAIVKELGMETGVRFTGYRTDLPGFFGLGGFYLRTSVNESGNMSNVLAQFAGLICIGFRMKTVNRSDIDFIEHGKTGILVSWNDVTAMASAVQDHIDNPSRKKELGEHSRAFASEHRDINKLMIQPFVASYRTLSKKDAD